MLVRLAPESWTGMAGIRNRAQRSLGRVVVDLDAPVVPKGMKR